MSAKVLSNLESIGDLIGSYLGVAEAVNQDRYLGEIIEEAHGKAKSAFDIAAAATASAGALSHVYEFGTAGITRGPVRFPDPTAPEARLWVHTLTGLGGAQDIGYTFRPALAPNPQPTTAHTGVPSKYLRRLSKRKYVFHNKAFIIETGRTVTIRSRQAHGMLFVPFYGEFSDNPNNKRGYMMWNTRTRGPLKTNPGVMTGRFGNFEAFWLRWWGGAGEEIIDNSMRQRIESDTLMAQQRAAARANKNQPKPPELTNITAATAKSKKIAEQEFGKGR